MIPRAPYALYTAAQMRALDAAAIAHGTAGRRLMEAAGAATARVLRNDPRAVEPFLLLCGPGNNGGDAFVVARHLYEAGRRVSLWLLSAPETLSGDARSAFLDLPEGCPRRLLGETLGERERTELRGAGTIIDGLFGTGLTRAVSGPAAEWLALANEAPAYRVALDLPSGVCADSGRVLGPAFRADLTTTYAGLKQGLLSYPAAAYAGRLALCDIGVPREVAEASSVGGLLATQDVVRGLLPRRDPWTHKGSYGHLLMAAGSPAMPGAALLAARAALRGGVGLVTVFSEGSVLAALHASLPEALGLAADTNDAAGRHERFLSAALSKSALLIGPGLGQDARAAKLIAAALSAAAQVPLLLDADGLNLLAQAGLGAARERAAQGGTLVLTPHPKEAARLLACETEEIQADRFAAARRLARESQAVVVLKGARTLVAAPEGALWLVPYGDSSLAKGGTGDVLAGLIGSFLAQGLKACEAAVLGGVAHALAGERQGLLCGTRGVLAGEVADALGPLWARWERGENAFCRFDAAFEEPGQ